MSYPAVEVRASAAHFLKKVEDLKQEQEAFI